MSSQNQMFGVMGGVGNPMMQGMMPGMMMPGMNPGMVPGMMPGMNPGMMPGLMPGLNPGMMPGMIPGMNHAFIPMKKPPLTEEQKRKIRYQGYLEGKKRALEKKKTLEAQNPKVNMSNNNQSQQPQPTNGEITVRFKKGSTITKIKMKADSMVAELIDAYFHKTKTKNGNFKFQGNTFTPTTPFTLTEAGLTDNSEIVVS